MRVLVSFLSLDLRFHFVDPAGLLFLVLEWCSGYIIYRVLIFIGDYGAILACLGGSHFSSIILRQRIMD